MGKVCSLINPPHFVALADPVESPKWGVRQRHSPPFWLYYETHQGKIEKAQSNSNETYLNRADAVASERFSVLVEQNTAVPTIDKNDNRLVDNVRTESY